MRRTRVAALTVAAVVPLLAGCGIQQTDVIEAGGPATVEAFYNREDDMLLFFHTTDGDLTPVIRTVRTPSTEFGSSYVNPDAPDTTPGPPPTEKTVLALLAGPQEQDRTAGLTTALPRAHDGQTVTTEAATDNSLTTTLPLPLKTLTPTALRQLTCTIAYSRAPDGRITVRLTGNDGTSTTATCDLAGGG